MMLGLEWTEEKCIQLPLMKKDMKFINHNQVKIDKVTIANLKSVGKREKLA